MRSTPLAHSGRRSSQPRWWAARIIGLLGLLCVTGVLTDAQRSARADTSPELSLTPTQLEQMQTLVGEITIKRLNVFDSEDPDENKAIHGVANAAHVRSREGLIRSQLLFASGDRFSQQALEETERLLRDNKYIYDVSIVPSRLEQGRVDILVITQDVWTLTASASASRSGGRNKSGLSLKELNLFGTGVGIELSRKSDVDRNSTLLRIVDNHIGGSRYAGYAGWSRNSDGHRRELGIGLPFHSLDARRAHQLSAWDEHSIEPLYNLGKIVDTYGHEQTGTELRFGWSEGLRDGWVRRYETGLAMERHHFTDVLATSGIAPLPADRSFTYPFIGFELIENRFEKASNVHQIQRTEDIFLGTKIAARVGYASDAFGSDNAWLGTASISTGFGTTAATWLQLEADTRGRWQDGELRDFLIGGSGALNWRQTENLSLNVRLEAEIGQNLDVDRQLLLGGDDGLRGYPLRYQRGEHRALLSIEQRLFTRWEPFTLFNVGAVAFADVGRVWGDVDADNLGLLSDIGVGLRLGNRRSGSGRMIHIDVAMPLNGAADIDGLQLLIGTQKQF